MKKLFLLIAVLVGAGIAGGLYLKRAHGPQVARAAELAPADAIFFAQIPSLAQTGERWKGTDLFQLWNEPEMQAFLEKPRAKMAIEAGWGTQLDRFQKIAPGEVFVAVTSIDGPVPQFVAGFSFSGGRSQVEALMAEPIATFKKAHPAGRAELISYGAAEIEAFTDKEETLAGVFREDWYFLSDNVELLQRTLDRYDRKNGAEANSLAGAAIFAEATAPLPPERDALLFANLGTVMDRLGALLAASGQKVDAAQIAEMKKTRAIAASSKLDGRQFRDTIFVLQPGAAHATPLARHSLAFTSPGTLLYSAMALPASLDLSDSLGAMAALIVPALEPMNQALAAKGLAWNDLRKAFGPEIGAVVDWQAAALQPSAMLALDVRDAAKAAAFAEVFTAAKPGGPAWLKREQDGISMFTPPADGIAFVTPTLALTDKFLVAGLSAETVEPMLARLKSGEAKMSGPAFADAEKTLAVPTDGFGYVDLRGLFERAYGTFRPFIIMSLAFAPEVGEYIDGAKLPSTETLAKHLGPIVMSQSTTERGTLWESTGTLTLDQVLLGLAGGAISAALPNLQNLDATGFDPSKLLQSLAPKPGK